MVLIAPPGGPIRHCESHAVTTGSNLLNETCMPEKSHLNLIEHSGGFQGKLRIEVHVKTTPQDITRREICPGLFSKLRYGGGKEGAVVE